MNTRTVPSPNRLERPDLDDESQDARWRADLPPKELWKLNPSNPDELLETPVTEQGLVKVRELIMLGRTAVADGYAWNMSATRKDHLFWPGTAYNWLAWKLDSDIPLLFKDLPPNQVKLPLEFERWKHTVTIPPDFPRIEVMRYSIEAWQTARDLYISIRKMTEWERHRRNRIAGLISGSTKSVPRDPQDTEFEQFYLGEVASHSRGAERSLEQHVKLPPEFRLVDPQEDARRILSIIGYQVRNHCRDGLKVAAHLLPKVA